MFVFDHHIAVRNDGSHQDRPVPHTLRYSVPENRIDILRCNLAYSLIIGYPGSTIRAASFLVGGSGSYGFPNGSRQSNVLIRSGLLVIN